MVDTFFTKKVIGSGENKLTIPDAMKQQTFGKVYIMLGVNELGWSYEDVFIQKYGELVDEAKKLQPEATVFIQSILPVSKAKSDRDKVYNNAKINRYNELIKEMAEKMCIRDRTIARALNLNEDLTEAIALGHDLGHTPFGHAGERALNRICPFPFYHHLQSVRVTDVLERDGKGLNLHLS